MAFGLLNQEARALEQDGVDTIQFDQPAFNVYMDEVATWGISALERAAAGLHCTTAVHICYGYGFGEYRLERLSGRGMAAIRADVSGAGTALSIRCHWNAAMRGYARLLELLDGKDVLVGVIDVATDKVETPGTGRRGDRGRASVCRPNGYSPAPIAAWRRCSSTSPTAKLVALGPGAALVRGRRGV